jgi:abhydrolase domain-containing protein 17
MMTSSQWTRRTLRAVLDKMLVIAIGLYLVLIALAIFSDRLIFQPQPSTYTDDMLRLQPNTQLIKIKSGDKTITAAYLPNANARHLLLFSHGNAEDLGNDVPWLDDLRTAGFAVLAYDYRGYGTSEGSSSEKTVYEDVLATYGYATGELHFPPERIISYGRSLGCGAAIELAYRKPVAGLITEAPFLTAFRVLTRVPLLPWDKFRNVDKIGEIHVPVLVIQGDKDQVVPPSQGRRIFAAAHEPKYSLWVPGAGHNDVTFVAPKEYTRSVQAFSRSLGGKT